MNQSEIPRRIQLERMTPAERAIHDAVQVVEAAGCDVRLTKAVILLQKARDMVADFVDGVDQSPKPDVLQQVVAEREDYRMKWTQAQHETALAEKRIKSLEDGIVAENRRTSAIEAELRTVKDLLIARDEDYHPDGPATVAEVVERILGERDDAEEECSAAKGDIKAVRDLLASRDEDFKLDGIVSIIQVVQWVLDERTELLSRVKGLANSLEAQSRALDAADERASTATDILCVALGADHGRGGLVEHCQKAAGKIAELKSEREAFAAECRDWTNAMYRALKREMSGMGTPQQIGERAYALILDLEQIWQSVDEVVGLLEGRMRLVLALTREPPPTPDEWIVSTFREYSSHDAVLHGQRLVQALGAVTELNEGDIEVGLGPPGMLEVTIRGEVTWLVAPSRMPWPGVSVRAFFPRTKGNIQRCRGIAGGRSRICGSC